VNEESSDPGAEGGLREDFADPRKAGTSVIRDGRDDGIVGLNEFLSELERPLDWRYRSNLIEVSEPELVISSTMLRVEQSPEDSFSPPLPGWWR